MKQPEVVVHHRKGRLVCKLNKSLYGLKQSHRQWYKKFDSFMVSHGYTRTEYDHCLYLKKLNDIFIILVLYVDYMLIVSKIMDEINRLKAQMARTFDMKDLGAAKKSLGIEIHIDRRNGKLSFSQEKYVEKILVIFKMNKTKPSSGLPF